MPLNVCLLMPKIEDNNLTPPLGLLYIASILEEEGHHVSFFDARIDASVIEKIVESKPDVIGVTAVTPSFRSGVEIASAVKKSLPNTNVVFGGPHPSTLPEDTLTYPAVDFVVLGEGEFAMKELCRVIEYGGDLSSVENICYLENGEYKSNGLTHILSEEELNKIPFPAFHLLEIEKYFREDKSYGVFLKSSRNLPIISSRGCPSACTFCRRMMGARFRARSPESVLSELEYLVKEFNVKEVHFVDDNFTHDRERAVKILDGILERDICVAIKFPNGMRADRTDLDLFYRMKKSGVYSIGFGVESGSPRILKLMHKDITLERVTEAIVNAKKAGLLVSAGFIIGYPGETKDDIMKTIDYALSVPLDSASIITLVPFPGTVVRKICEEKGYLTEEARDWNNYIFVRNKPFNLLQTEYLTFKDIKEYTALFHRRFYLRPSYMLRMLRVLNFTQIIRGIKTVFFPFLPH